MRNKKQKKSGGSQKKNLLTRTVPLKRVPIFAGILLALVLIAGLSIRILIPDRPVKPADPPKTPPASYKIKPPAPEPPRAGIPAPEPEKTDKPKDIPPQVFEDYSHSVPVEIRQDPDVPAFPSDGRPQVAIIIDDMGNDIRAAKCLAALEPSITWSILPKSRYQKQTVQLAAESGVEIMLHLPMEPREYPGIDPGPGALLSSMSPL